MRERMMVDLTKALHPDCRECCLKSSSRCLGLSTVYVSNQLHEASRKSGHLLP